MDAADDAGDLASSLLQIRFASDRARLADLDRFIEAASGSDVARRTSLQDRIRDQTTQTVGLMAAAGHLSAWDGDQDSALLVDELMALLQTSLLRQHGLDNGEFAAAEALVNEVTQRAGLPQLVLGQTQGWESVDHSRAAVAMHFPGARVWNLPFLVHEVAHMAVAKLPHLDQLLADTRPLAEIETSVAKILETESDPLRSRAHAAELLADVVATISLGATYAVACLCLRAPGDARRNVATETHPAWRDRVASMRATLDQMSLCSGMARFQNTRATKVDPLVTAVFGELPGARPAGFEATRAVEAVWRHRRGLFYLDADAAIRVAQALTNTAPDPPAGATVLAVVDGAWRWRMDHLAPSAHDEPVAALAAHYCRAVRGRSCS